MINKVPRLHVNAKVVIRTADEFAYLTYPSGMHDLPGGHIEFGETVIDGLRREVQEELGYTMPTEPRLIGIWEYISQSRQSHTVYIGYMMQLTDKPELRYIEHDDGTILNWLHRDSIVQHGFYPQFEKMILQAMDLKL